MQANTLLFDTTVSNISGSGSINFGNERLDLTLLPKAKETSLITLRRFCTEHTLTLNFKEPSHA